jgi:predicted glycogen debranching enzyme
MDADGLIARGVPGMQLTWMDAKVGDRVVTPRIGKPVEVQALWISALRSAGGRYQTIADRAQTAFRERFWNASAGCLYDVVDADHLPGQVDRCSNVSGRAVSSLRRCC